MLIVVGSAAPENSKKTIGGDTMEAKSYLKQVRNSMVKVKNKLFEAQKWRDIALSITSYMDGDRVQSSSPKDKMANAVEECESAEGQVLEKVKELRSVMEDVTGTIERMDNATEYDVLHQIYIQSKSLQDVADDYKNDYTWATTTHGRALKSVQAILDEQEKE